MNGGGGLVNEMTPHVNEFYRLRSLAKLGFTAGPIGERPADEIDRFFMLSQEFESARADQMKKGAKK